VGSGTELCSLPYEIPVEPRGVALADKRMNVLKVKNPSSRNHMKATAAYAVKNIRIGELYACLALHAKPQNVERQQPVLESCFCI
jgi:hypothetical protein